MDPMNMMDQEMLKDDAALEGKLMEKAREMDTIQEVADTDAVMGDFSKVALNRLVDAVNRVNILFQAPKYPEFDANMDRLPPEFIRNLEMVNAAARDAGLDDYTFNIFEASDDKDLKMVAGKIDSAAMDKSFKAFLNKPQGMGDLQAEAGVPEMQMTGADVGVMAQAPMEEEEDEEELFMARMKA